MTLPADPLATPRYAPRTRHRVPYWLLAIILLGVIIGWAIVSNDDYARIWRNVSRGISTTLFVTLVAFGCACVLGMLIAMARTSRHRILSEAATFYVEVVRGVPVLVLLFYIAFAGAPALVGLYSTMFGAEIEAGVLPALTVRNFDFTWRAILALTIGYSAFIAEIFRAGIEAVDRGQREAAQALGLSRWATFRHVVAPQAIRTVLPPLGNDFVAMIKDSALVSALGVQDITQIGNVYAASNFQFFETYNVVAFLYLVLTISLSLLVRGLEHLMQKSQRR